MRICFAFAFLGGAIVRQPPSSGPSQLRLNQTLAGRVLIGLAIGLGLSGWAVYAPIITNANYLNPSPVERDLLKFLETLPKDVLIAGSPCVLDSVELFAKRQVLFACEDSSGDLEALQAYYTDDQQAIVDFCQTQEIDYLVVDLETYSQEYLARGWIYYEPLNQKLLPYVASRDTFVLTQVPDDVKVFQSENYFVVACDEL